MNEEMKRALLNLRARQEAGEHMPCPRCGRATEVYSRITGYYRPVQNWNDGKIQEFADRRTYEIKKG